MKRAESTAPAVILGVTTGVGLSITRDLAREGVPVVAMGSVVEAASMRSRYCVRASAVEPRGRDDEFLADLASVSAMIGRKAVLFAADDEYVAAIARHKARLQEDFLVPMLGWERMQLMVDKEQQLQLARQAGVVIPVTAIISTPEDRAVAAQTVPFPAVLKAVRPNVLRGRTGLKVIRVDTRDALDEACESIAFCGTLILQELIPGPDDAVFLSGAYHDADSRPQALFTGRKLRQHPRGFGDTRAGESMWSDELADLTLKLLGAVPYHGVSDVEFKRDSRDGRFKLMEANPRLGLWCTLATVSGVNLAHVAYCDAIGRPYAAPRQVDGVRWIDLLIDGPASLKEMARGQLKPAQWLGSLSGLRADCFLSARDPVPGVLEARRIARSHWRKWRKRRGATRA
jgi:predicted ATP-grasp superfamily ATP-dependent carboligase